jgi:peptidoglycan hydrolase-like protein with peptidoglycan-binding domain
MTYFNITSDAYAIMQIQRILRDLELLDNEYSSVPISGAYDSETREAVAEFQSKYELEPTGIVDYDTWSLLHFVHKSSEFERRGPRRVQLVPNKGGFAIYPDQIDDIIYVIQYMLSTVSVHYDDFGELTFTGIYDESTQDAIKAFQRKNLLEPNGIIDGATLEALFDEYEGTILERS